MNRVRPLLTVKNGKLGKSIFHFDLPAIDTCPGRSEEVCARFCYATHGRFATRRVKSRLAWCYRQSLRKDFADRMISAIHAAGVIVCRLHVSGDFYTPVYARKWLRVMRECDRVRFFAYTRSWRVEAIAPVLEEMAGRENLSLWYSCDAETGEPESVPPGVRLAYLQHALEAVPERSQLLFRTRKMRSASRVGLPMICPQETNKSVNCGNCQHCWR